MKMFLQPKLEFFQEGRMRIKLYTAITLAIVLFLSACGKSDADLQKAANDKLAAEKISNITVTVKDNVATLSGDTKDATAKSRAEAAVKSIDGIKSVTDTINFVTPPPTTPPPPDPMLQGKIDEALKKAGCTGATASIKDGVVTLTGSVAETKYAPCIQAASQVGAGKLDNQLQKGK
jgi:hyperosmotically inducible protein